MAALISSQSFSLLEGTEPFAAEHLCDFWSHGQKHIKHRRATLEAFAQSELKIEASVDELEIIFRDFFAEEMLIRVVTAIFTAADQRRGQCQAEPIARSLFLSFLDVKRIILKILVSEQGLSTDTLKRINTTRRSIERWTDMLLGQYVQRLGLDEFVHDVERARDFGEDQLSEQNAIHAAQTWNLINAGLRVSFPSGLTSQSTADWETMLSAVLACFPADCFSQAAIMKSLRQIRYERSGAGADSSPDVLPEILRQRMLGLSISDVSPGKMSKEISPFDSHKPAFPSPQSISFTQIRHRNQKESS